MGMQKGEIVPLFGWRSDFVFSPNWGEREA